MAADNAVDLAILMIRGHQKNYRQRGLASHRRHWVSGRDDDEIFIVDRLKELIKYKGFQVAPDPDIADGAVVPMKYDLAGEVPVAFVVRSTGSEIMEEEIKKYIAKQVVFYKRINRVFRSRYLARSRGRKDLRAKLAAGIPNGKHP